MGNPLRYTDPTGLNVQDSGTAEDQRREQNRQQPQPQQQQSQGARIETTLPKTEILKGEQLKLPDGEPAVSSNGKPVIGYGPVAVATHTAYDENGDPVEPDSDYTLEEKVVFDPDNPATPADAAKLTTSISQPRPIELGPGGIAYDVMGVILPSEKDYQAVAARDFTITKLQTLTLKNADGDVIATRVNRIKMTPTSISVQEVKPPKP